jgi:hypothetical protein
MIQEIQDVTEKRFKLANSAPINTSSLHQSIGFCASTEFAINLLQQKIPIPGELDDYTVMLIEEMQCLFVQLQPLHSPTTILLQVYRYYWGHINESTLSVWSRIHFGHWKAIGKSDELTTLTCTQLNLVAATGILPSCWGTDLQVLLEKVPGVALINKLRTILLMEGDFNFFNKWFFRHEAVNRLYKIGYVPEDQYSKKSSTVEDSKLDNRLTMDLSQQLQLPLITILAEADKCYNRINHIVMSLLLLAITGEQGPIQAMLQPIQQMKFYQ